MTVQTNVASFPPDPRRLGDEYRQAVRSDRDAFSARVNPGPHSVAYDRGNGAQYGQRPDLPVMDDPHGPPTEQGRLFRPAVGRTDQRVDASRF